MTDIGNQEPRRGARGTLLHGAALTMAGLVLTGAVRAVVRIGAERWFGVEALGILTLAMSVAAIVTIVGPGGLSAGVTKFIAQFRGGQDPARTRDLGILAARAGVTFSLLGAAGGVVYILLSDQLEVSTPEVLAAAALILSFGFYLSGKSILYGEDRILGYLRREIVGSVLFAIVLLLALLLDAAPLMILALCAAYLPVGATTWRAVRHMGHARRLPVRSLAGYGLIGVVGSLAGVGFSYTTPLAAAYVDALAGAALIGGILTILEPLNLLPRAISLVLLPTLSRSNAQSETAKSGASLLLATALVTAATAPVFAIIVLERGRLLGIFFRDLTGGATLGWFSLAFFIRIVGTPAVAALAAIDVRRASISMWSSLVGFSLAIGIWVAAAPEMGVGAIGLGYAIGSAIQVAAPLIVATRRYSVRWASLWYRVVAAGITVAALATMPPRVVTDIVAVCVVLAFMSPEVRQVVRLIRARAWQRSDSPPANDAGQLP